MSAKNKKKWPHVQDGKTHWMDVGVYRLSRDAHMPGKIWLTRIDDGEGMQTDEAKLAAAIGKFYHREF